jgi:hypothetical protein
MITTSVEYKTAIKDTVRKLKGKVEITWQSAEIDPTISAFSNDENYVKTIFNLDKQSANGKTTPTYKWFSLNYNLLDGTFHPMPGSETEAAQNEVGFWNGTACDGSKEWSPPYPYLHVSFGGSEGSAVRQLNVYGDSIYNEYPVNFDIDIYHGEALLYHLEVRNNDQLNWSKDISDQGINNATHMILTLGSWSTANRLAKILEFYSSLVDTFYGDDIVSMDILEEREISDGTIPVGNISSNELDLKLQNIKIGSLRDPFTFGNTASYIATSLKPGRKIIPYIGIQLPDTSIEYIPMGTFFSGGWQTSIKDGSVSTTALDRLSLLNKAIFRESLIYTNMKLSDLAETILLDAKYNIPMPALTWDVDDELDDYEVPLAYFPVQSYFTCLRDIVEACGGQCYMSRDDILTITGPSFAGVEDAEYSITKNDSFDIRQPSKPEELKNKIQIPVSRLSSEGSQTAYESEWISIEIGEELSLICDYSGYPVDEAEAEISDTEVVGIEIIDQFCYACAAYVTVKNNGIAVGSFKLKITGTKYSPKSDEIVEASDIDSIIEYGERIFSLNANQLLQDRVMAQMLADALLVSYKDYRRDIVLDCRGDPSLELGDIIDAPIYQRGAIDETASFIIYKNEFQFDGALKEKTEARRIE